MTSFNKFNQFVGDLAVKVHNLGADTLKVMLTNTAPTASNAVKSDIIEIGSGNGYAAGGNTLTTSSSGQTSGTYKLVVADSTFTANTGNIGPFRYAVVYNDTPTSPAKPLIGWYDYGSSVTLNGASGDTFTVDFDNTNGLLQVA